MILPSTRFRLAALGAALAAWALVAVGGVVRVTESGLGCPDWPLCEGRAVPAGGRREALIEFSHRATAAVVTALVVAAWAWRRYRLRRDILVPALVAVALVPLQAVLGAIVVWLELPAWIVGVHFVVACSFSPPPSLPPPRRDARDGRLRHGASLGSPGQRPASVSSSSPPARRSWRRRRTTPTARNGRRATARSSPAAATRASRSSTGASPTSSPCSRSRSPSSRGVGPGRGLRRLPPAAIAGQMGIGIAIVLAGEESGAHATLAALHVAGAGAVWASLVALAALAGSVARLLAPGPASGHEEGGMKGTLTVTG